MATAGGKGYRVTWAAAELMGGENIARLGLTLHAPAGAEGGNLPLGHGDGERLREAIADATASDDSEELTALVAELKLALPEDTNATVVAALEAVATAGGKGYSVAWAAAEWIGDECIARLGLTLHAPAGAEGANLPLGKGDGERLREAIADAAVSDDSEELTALVEELKLALPEDTDATVVAALEAVATAGGKGYSVTWAAASATGFARLGLTLQLPGSAPAVTLWLDYPQGEPLRAALGADGEPVDMARVREIVNSAGLAESGDATVAAAARLLLESADGAGFSAKWAAASAGGSVVSEATAPLCRSAAASGTKSRSRPGGARRTARTTAEQVAEQEVSAAATVRAAPAAAAPDDSHPPNAAPSTLLPEPAKPTCPAPSRRHRLRAPAHCPPCTRYDLDGRMRRRRLASLPRVNTRRHHAQNAPPAPPSRAPSSQGPRSASPPTRRRLPWPRYLPQGIRQRCPRHASSPALPPNPYRTRQTPRSCVAACRRARAKDRPCTTAPAPRR